MAAVSARMRFGERATSRIPRYWHGDTVVVWCDFFLTNAPGTPADAGTVTAHVYLPGGTLLEPAIDPVEESTGVWYVVIPADYAGTYQVEMACKTPDIGKDARSFVVVEREAGSAPPTASPVSSVNGSTGAVVLAYGDVGAQQANARLAAVAASGATSGLMEWGSGNTVTSRTMGVAAGTSIPTAADLVAQNIAYASEWAGAVTRDMRERAQDVIHAEDFVSGVAPGSEASFSSASGTVLNALISLCAASRRTLVLGDGLSYFVTAGIAETGKDGWGIRGKAGAILGRRSAGINIISLTDCDDVRFDGVHLTGRWSALSNESRIELKNCKCVTFNHCTIEWLRGIEVEATADGGSTELMVTNCRFREAYTAMMLGQTPGPDSGLPNVGRILFAHNIVQGTYQEAIECNRRWEKVLIAFNHFQDCNRQANEEVIDAGGAGSSELVIIGNTFDQAGNLYADAQGCRRAIYVKTADGHPPNNCIVANNRIGGVFDATGGACIHLDTINYAVCIGNTVTCAYLGINFQDCDTIVVANNSVNGLGFAGIYSAGGSAGAVISGNSIELAPQSGIGTCDGILMSASLGHTVIGNAIRGTPINGVRLTGSAADCAIVGNTFNGATSYAINVAAASRVSVQGNVIRDCARAIENRAPDASIVGNVCEGAGANSGILLHATGVGATCVGNTVQGFLVGIDVQAVGAIVTANRSTNQVAGATSCGFRIGASVTDAILTSNRATDTQGTKTQAYGLRVTTGCDYIILRDNNFRGNVTAGVLNLVNLGANSQGSASDNIGTA